MGTVTVPSGGGGGRVLTALQFFLLLQFFCPKGTMFFNQFIGCISTFLFCLFTATIIYSSECDHTLIIHRLWVDKVLKKDTVYNKFFKKGTFKKISVYWWSFVLSVSLIVFIAQLSKNELNIFLISPVLIYLLIRHSDKFLTWDLVDNLRPTAINRIVSFVNTSVLSIVFLINDINSSSKFLNVHKEEIAEIIASEIKPLCLLVRYAARLGDFFDIELVKLLQSSHNMISADEISYLLIVLLVFLLVVWLPLLGFSKGILGIYHQVNGYTKISISNNVLSITFVDPLKNNNPPINSMPGGGKCLILTIIRKNL